MKKRILSLILVLCMLLPMVPTTLFAAEAEPIVYQYADVYGNFNKTISETVANEQGLAVDKYEEWLRQAGIFAIDQGNYDWKVGDFDPTTGALDPFARVAFFANDNKTTYRHDTTWAVTESAYQKMVGDYMTSYKANGNKYGSADIWGGYALCGQNSFTGLTASGSGGKYSAIAYTVEQDGAYTFSLSSLNETGGHTFAIFVGSEPVWPAGATGTKTSTWYATTKGMSMNTVNAAMAEMEAVSVRKGQTISFVVSIGTSGNPMYVEPVVTRVGDYVEKPEIFKYSDAAGKFTKTISESKCGATDANLEDGSYLAWLQQEGIFAVNQGNAPWKIGELNLTTGELAPFSRVAFFADDNDDTSAHNTAWLVTEETYQRLLPGYISSLQKNTGGLYYGSSSIWNGEALCGMSSFYKMASSSATKYSAMQFTAPADGGYAFSLATYSNTDSHYFAVMVDNTVVWPTDAKADDKTTWYVVTSSTTAAEINAALSALPLQQLSAGQTVSYVIGKKDKSDARIDLAPVVSYVPDGYVCINLIDETLGTSKTVYPAIGSSLKLPYYVDIIGWDTNGDGEVDYLNGATVVVPATGGSWKAVYPPTTVFKKGENHPTWDAENNKVVFYDNWDIGVYNKALNVFMPVYTSNGTFLISVAGGPWSGKGCGLYMTNDTTSPHYGQMAVTGSLSENNYRHSIRYTAPYSGKVELSWESFTGIREVNPNEAASKIIFGFAIYKNGEKIWPTSEDWKMYESETTYDVGVGGSLDIGALMEAEGIFPITADVNEGDRIEFRTLQGSGTVYMMKSSPMVSYQSVTTDYYEDTVGGSSYNQGAGMYCMDVDAQTGKVIMPAGWSFVGYKNTGYGVDPLVLDTLVVACEAGTAYTYEEGVDIYSRWGDSWIVAASRVGKPAGGRGGYPAINWVSGVDARWDYWGGRGCVVSNSTYDAGYQYTVSKTGYVNISIDKLETRGSQNRYAAIFVDGVMVWPTAGGSYTNSADWCNLQTYKTAGNTSREDIAPKLGDLSYLRGIYVEAGDKVEMLFRNTSEGHTARAYLTVEEVAVRDTASYVAIKDGVARMYPALAGTTFTVPTHMALDGFGGWDADGNGKPDLANGGTVLVGAKPTVLTPVYNDGSADRFDQNLPYTYDGTTVTGYDTTNTNWQITKGDWNVDFVANPDTKLTLSGLREMSKLSSGIFQYDGEGLWGANGGGMYSYRKFAVRGSDSKIAVGATYVAPYSGVVDLDYTNVAGRWEINANDGHEYVTVDGVKYYAYYTAKTDTSTDYYYFKDRVAYSRTLSEGGAYYAYDGTTMTEKTATAADAGTKNEVYMSYQTGAYFAIVLNGEVIWPSNGKPFHYQSDDKNSPFSQSGGDDTALAKMRAYEAFPTNLYVKAGDKISFVATRDHWLSNMVYMDPVVTYTAVYEKVETSASVSLGDKFAVDFIASNRDPRATKYGVEIISGISEGIVAKNLDAEITYRPYQIIDGTTIYFAEKTTSLAAILSLYANDTTGIVTADQKALAEALLRYGATADSYFNGTPLSAEDLAALAGVSVDTSKEAQEVGATLDPSVTERTYEMTAVKLLLEDAVEIKVFFKALSGEAVTDLSSFKLLVANEYGVTKALVDSGFVYRAGTGEKEIGASFSVPATEYNETLYITLLSGNAMVSETRTYSVKTYIARKFGTEEGTMDNILRAITDVANKASKIRTQIVAATDTTTYKYCGTWEPSGTSMISHWNESYVEVDFYGTSVTPVFGKSSPIKYSIDGGSYTSTTANGELTITAATDGKHTLRIKTQGRGSNVYFAGVKTESKLLLSRTAEKEHYIHFIGDSISDDGNSFSRRVGDVLGWDYATTAVAGMALETNYGYWKNNNPAMYAELGINVGMEDAFFKYGHPTDSWTGETRAKYLNYYTDSSLNNTYETGYAPDIVFIFLGTNDELGKDTDATRFTEAYVQFVENILAVYGADTEIWALQALTNSQPTINEASPRFTCIRAAANALKAKYGDQINFIDYDVIKTWGVQISSDNTHPTLAGYNTLTNEISAILKAFYEGKEEE
ncbi:MAG: hypothetical protein IJY20_00155 [Clostridia bacterium]|nr:hypothetical protein [Clostridia bacterium]